MLNEMVIASQIKHNKYVSVKYNMYRTSTIHHAIIFFSVSEDSAQLDGVSSLCDIRGPASAGLSHDDVINAPRRKLGGR